MTHQQETEAPRPTLVFLHALGASQREWEQVIALLPEYECVTLDLPGFGDLPLANLTDVGSLTNWLTDEIGKRQLITCVLVGHSMGGKIVTLAAARAASGQSELNCVRRVVLVAASPPSPEPMDEDRRSEMIGWFADGRPTESDAATFVDANTADRLPQALREQAMADVLRCDPDAWLAWLEHGSREDWSATIGQIDLPAMIIAGAQDGDLGGAAQRRLNLPLYRNGRIEVVADAAHLIPYEQPGVLAALIDCHAASVTATP
jgi:pimeloyl-ACP methyl ester carboxylesterase